MDDILQGAKVGQSNQPAPSQTALRTDYTKTLTFDEAFECYEKIRHRLPQARFNAFINFAPSLSEMAEAVDAFILDAFGVLNVGNQPIPGAIERIAELRERGKKLIVLTNAASDTKRAAMAKYNRLGFDFTEEEVVASRDVAASRLESVIPGGVWGAVSTSADNFYDLPADVWRWTAQERPNVDGFLLLSSAEFDPATEAALIDALIQEPRPVVVANPDVVAPRETGLSCEPGYFAHKLADQLGLEPVFFGKPFGDAYADTLARLDGIPRERIAMVGDTLHTDVLGGAAAGIKTVLISNHGLFAGAPLETCIKQSGIYPNYICRTT